MTVPFEDIYHLIYPHVMGCPEVIVENAVRQTAQDFCARTKVEKYEMDPQTVVAGINEYDLEAPADMMVHSVHTVNINGDPIHALNEKLVEQRYPRHREYTGPAEGYVRKADKLFIYPKPDITIPNGLFVTTVVKPSPFSTTMPEIVYMDHHELIVSGALARLMIMPKRDWTDLQLAPVHAGAYERGVQDVERRARKADEGATPVVRYGGIGAGRKRTFRRGW